MAWNARTGKVRGCGYEVGGSAGQACRTPICYGHGMWHALTLPFFLWASIEDARGSPQPQDVIKICEANLSTTKMPRKHIFLIPIKMDVWGSSGLICLMWIRGRPWIMQWRPPMPPNFGIFCVRKRYKLLIDSKTEQTIQNLDKLGLGLSFGVILYCFLSLKNDQ